jgi:hypothetical protein
MKKTVIWVTDADGAAICLTITDLENTGVFESAFELWRLKPEADRTMDNFKKHFCTINKARLAKLTAQTAGYHGAHAASSVSPSVTGISTPPAPLPVINGVTAMTPSVLTDDSVRMYYCWSHGLGKNKEHTSRTCQRPKEGHCETATANNMMGATIQLVVDVPAVPKLTPETEGSLLIRNKVMM